jgi:hypothetical protein
MELWRWYGFSKIYQFVVPFLDEVLNFSILTKLPLARILSQMNLDCVVFLIYVTYFNGTVSYAHSLLRVFSFQVIRLLYYLPHVCDITCPRQTLFDVPNNTWWRIIHKAPYHESSCYLLYLRSKYFSQHSLLKYPQFMFVREAEKQSMMRETVFHTCTKQARLWFYLCF